MSLLVYLSCLLGVSAGPSIVASQPAPGTWLKHALVTVKWSGVTGDQSNDWVSAWWHHYQPTYIQYKNVTTHSGEGSFTFDLLNARHHYYFRYYRGNDILATSNLVQPDAGAPMQTRLTLVGSDYTSIRIAWTTNDTMGVVQYGTDPTKLTNTQNSTNTTYTHDDINNKLKLPYIPIMDKSFADIGSRYRRCNSKAPNPCSDDNTACAHFIDPGIFHEAILSGLQPKTTYYYRVGTPTYWSDVYSFTSLPLPGDADNVSVLYIADGGVGANGKMGEFSGGALNNDDSANGADEVWAAIAADEVNSDTLAILNGDISYASGWPWTWEVFHNLTEPIFRKLPVQIAYGNHDFDWSNNPYYPKGKDTGFPNGTDSGGEAGIPCAKRFAMPQSTSVSDWVVVQAVGSLTLITVSSEHSLSQQVTYLQSTVFPKIDRNATPWVVVQLHRPMYASNELNAFEHEVRAAFSDVFEKNGVNVVLTGHMHYYERMCAITAGACSTDGSGPVYILDGSAGAEFNPASTPASPITQYKEFNQWGYSRLVVNRTQLQWFHFHTDGKLVDHMSLP